ncbi:MAG: tetratricopeptide repeat protein [Phycisphaerales bacterium]
MRTPPTTTRPPVVSQQKPPVVSRPKPPVVVQPAPNDPRPPVVKNPPVVTKPPIVSRPKPPVVVQPPVAQPTPKPPVVSRPMPPVVTRPPVPQPTPIVSKPPIVRTPRPPVNDGRFERPLPPPRNSGLVGAGDHSRGDSQLVDVRDRGHDRGDRRDRHDRDDLFDRIRDRHRDHVSFFIGAGFGFGLSIGNFHHWRGSPFCYYDPFFYDPFCRPSYSYGDCRWSTWSACSSYSSWYCWPSAYYWPEHHGWRHHRVRRITYVRPHCDWLTEFRYCSVPTYTVAHCGLISPTVVYSEPPPPTIIFQSEPSTTVVYASAEPQPAPVVLPAPASPGQLLATSDRELGDTYLRLGDSPSAIRVYRQHLAAFPGDVQAARSLGLALIDLGEVLEGARQIELAYRIDPALSARPMSIDSLADREAMERALDTATRAANRADSASTWLAVVVIMQASDRRTPAMVALDRARTAGLDATVADSFASEFGS